MNATIKTFKARSSATDVLRQLGVPTRDYNLFIEPVDGGVACKIGLAQSHVEALKIQTGAPTVTNGLRRDVPAKTPSKKSKRGSKTDPVGESISATADNIANALSDVGATAASAAIVEAAEKAVTLVNPGTWPFPTAKALQAAAKASSAKPELAKSVRASKLNRAGAEKFVQKSGSTTVTGTVLKPAEKRTVSSVARALIVAGKTNEEVWDALVKEFKLEDSKKSYPAWYRRECKSKGLIK